MMLKKEKLELVRKFYPNALTTIDVLNKIIDFIEDELQMPPSTVMLADSICSDDVNSIQYPARATQEFLGFFKMGGLNGFPFTGLTGMGAFASHVPDDGAILIYYGPHIGISKEGKIGEILRYGQHATSGCCGAAKGALKKLSDGVLVEGNVTDMDYQMNTIEQIILKQKDRILGSETPVREATEVIYEAIDARIQELVAATTYNCKYVILMGGVMINSDSDVGSFSSTKRFDVINLEDKSKKSYLSFLS